LKNNKKAARRAEKAKNGPFREVIVVAMKN
jgi:hypothetical protein